MATNAGIIGVLRFQWGLTLDGTSCDFTFKSQDWWCFFGKKGFPQTPSKKL